MPVAITIPRLGWTMEEGLFAGWIKQHRESVRSGDPLFRLEGEKAVQDIECLEDGVLHIPADGPKEGDTVAVGAVIAFVLQPGEALPTAATAPPIQPVSPMEPVPAGPATRQLARELNVDLRQVTGSGPAGRIILEDVRGAGTKNSTPSNVAAHLPAISPRARRVAKELGVDSSRLTGTGSSGRIREKDVRAAVTAAPGGTKPEPSSQPLTPLRKTIAARMRHSLETTAPVTLTTTIDVANLVNLRRQFTAVGAGEVPSLTAFLIKLTAQALLLHPPLNSCWGERGIVSSPRVNIGVAVDTEAGLLVPVLHDVPGMALRQVAGHLRDLAKRARERTLTAAEMQGGTFTVTNLGAFGIDAFTPIINHPECAILGVGRIRREPVVGANDAITISDRMTLSLSFDHRIVDGAPAARFLQQLGTIIEQPGPWLMS